MLYYTFAYNWWRSRRQKAFSKNLHHAKGAYPFQEGTPKKEKRLFLTHFFKTIPSNWINLIAFIRRVIQRRVEKILDHAFIKHDSYHYWQSSAAWFLLFFLKDSWKCRCSISKKLTMFPHLHTYSYIIRLCRPLWSHTRNDVNVITKKIFFWDNQQQCPEQRRKICALNIKTTRASINRARITICVDKKFIDNVCKGYK